MMTPVYWVDVASLMYGDIVFGGENGHVAHH